MNKTPKHKSEPLIHITKRDDIVGWKTVLVYAIGVVVAFILCSILLVAFTKLSPLDVYSKMFKGTFGGKVTRMQSIHNVAILLCISLAVTPAFKMKFWNIGAEGQVLMGGLATAYCMINFKDMLPEPLLLVVMFLASVFFGMLWATIPAICKALWGTNETLFTLMMNYVAMTLVSFFVAVTDKSGRSDLGLINEKTGEQGYLPELFGKPYLFNIAIVIFVLVFVAIYLRYSKQGYEISVVGESENTANYIGINVKKVIIRTLMISGAICGLTGLMIVAGDQHSLKESIVNGRGFTAIMVSWMANFNPIVMIIVSALIVFLGEGGKSATSALNVDNSIGDVLTAIVIFVIIAFEFFTRYKINFRNRKENHK